MINKQINIRSYLALCLGCLLLTTISASAHSKQEIVGAWQQQVKSFQTVQLDYDLLVLDLADPFSADSLFILKHKFALSEDKYYSYLKFPNTSRDLSAMASAYNGDFYQKLTDEKGTVTVSRTKEEDNSEQPYLSPHPLTVQYQFAFLPDVSRTIKTLKKPETWKNLTDRITEIQPFTLNGQQGFTVNIKIPQSSKIYQVFVDEKTLWPRHWWNIDDSRDEKKVNEELGEMDVNTFISVDKDATLIFPSQIILRGVKNGRLINQAIINTVPKSLKINEPVPDDTFTLAPKNAKFVDADERARIFQERKKYEEASPVGLAQPRPNLGGDALGFNVKDANGVPVNLGAFKGKKAVILTFFPKCFSGGCDNHLSSLRDHQAEFDKAGVQVIAVSVDPAEGETGQKAFAERWKLTFPLIPDTERTLSLFYGALQDKKQRAARMTFLIDKAGIVRFIDTKVNVKTHGVDVLAKLRELKIIE